MIDFNRIIKNLSEKEIQKIITILQNELDGRIKKTQNFEFYFEAKDVPRSAHPYVARLIWNGKIERQFYSFERKYNKATVSVFGKYHASAGDVLEIRHDDKYTSWYLVTSNGNQVAYGRQAGKDGKHKLIELLKNNLTLQEVEENINKDFTDIYYGDVFGFERR